jgi:reactive intermediate/imine deaminase
MISSVAVVLACTAAPPPDRAEAEFLSSQETRALNLPFSDAVRVGDVLYLSGQVGNLPGTLELVPGGIAAEAHQALENIRSILTRNGSNLERVVKCTVFLANIGDWPAFNQVYVRFFPENPPARSALGANGLAVGAKVEVECIALAGETGRQ